MTPEPGFIMDSDETLRARKTRLVLLCSTIGFACFSVSIVYFYRFPILVNPLVSNVLILSILFAWTISLAASSFAATGHRQVSIVLVGIWLYAFTMRSIPELRLGAPFLHDAYFYMLSTQSILKGGTLSSSLSGLYPQINTQLAWPLMQLITVSGTTVTGIDPSIWYGFQEPAIGGLTCVATFLLARVATGRTSVALLAAMFVSSSDVVIYYQAEYHPQGLAVLALTLFLYSFLRARSSFGLSFSILTLFFAASLVFVHHFSSLFIALLAVGFIVVGFLAERTPLRRLKSIWHPGVFTADYTLWLFVAVAIFAYEILLNTEVMRGFIILLESAEPPSLLVTTGPGVPLFVTIGNAMKWGVLGLAVFAIWKFRASLTTELYRLLVLLVLLVSAGVVSDFLTGGPAERIIALYVPVGSVFAGLGVAQLLKTSRNMSPRVRLQTAAVLGAVAVLCLVGALNAEVPSLYFHGSAPNSFYWSSNDLSSVGVYNATGSWIARYTDANSIYVTEFDTRVIPFYYAGRPLNNDHYVDVAYGKLSDFTAPGFVIFNPSITYYYGGVAFDKPAFVRDHAVVYSNGYVAVAWNSSP